MELETADDVVQGTPGQHQEDQTINNDEESPANIKELDGGMKLAISALIRSCITTDPSLRAGCSESLSRIAEVQPLTVLSEWLVVLTQEREKVIRAQSGKKKSRDVSSEDMSGPACLVVCLAPVLRQITELQALNSGDVRHRAALGQVIAALVEEMMQDTSQDVIQSLLLLLAEFYMDKVMDVLLLHFQPNNSKVPCSVLRSFSQLCSSLPALTIPFCKTLVSNSVLLMKQVKQNDTDLKTEFAVLTDKIFEAIEEFTASNTDTDSAICREDFRCDGDLLYDLMFSVWLTQTKDGPARAKILEALAAITPFLSKEIIYDKGLAYISTLVGLYKKLSATAYFEITFCLSQLLSSLSSSESLLLDSTMDPILTVLFQQVCIPVDFSQPKSVKNHFEILKCYDELMKVCSEKILFLVLFKLDLADDKSRLGGLTVLSHIMNDITKLNEKQTEDVCEKVWTKMNDANSKAQQVMGKIILQLCRRGKLSKEKKKGFIEFIVRLCGSEDEEAAQEGGRVLHLLTTSVASCEPELWTILLDSLLAEDFTRTVSAVTRSLAVLSQQRLDSGNIDMNYGTLRSTVTPYRLMARLVVTASDTATDNKETTINVLKFLQAFSVNINRHLVELWKTRIPLLVHFLEQNNEVDREQWSNWLCAFTTDSINQIGMEEWSCQFITALMEQLHLESSLAFTISCCAHILTIISSRQIVQDLIDLFYEKCLDGAIEVSDLLSVIQLVSTRHFELVLNKVESVYHNNVPKKGNLFSFIKEKFNEEKKQKNVTILFGCLEEAIKNAPLKELEFCADGITKRFLYPTLFNLKESNRSVEAALACVSTLSSTVRTILADSPSFCLSQRAELLHSSLGILQNTDSMPLHVRQAAANTLTFMVHLPPNIGQLTRCSILRAAFSTLVDSLDLQGATIRQDVISLLEVFIKQETHFAVLEEVFTLLEPYMHDKQTAVRRTGIEILLETLTLFLDNQEVSSADVEETFSSCPRIIGVLIPFCSSEELGVEASKCFRTLMKIYANCRKLDIKCEEELTIAETVITIFDWSEDVPPLLSTLCNTLDSKTTVAVILDIVKATAVSLASQSAAIVEKLCVSVAQGNLEASNDIFEQPNIADVIHQLALHDLPHVVSALLGLTELPQVITKTVWSCLGSDQAISAQIVNFLLDSLSFDTIRQMEEKDNEIFLCQQIMFALSTVLETRKQSAVCAERFTEMFTKFILVLSLAEQNSPAFQCSVSALQSMFSTLESVVVASSVMSEGNKKDIVTKLMTTVCYHAPQYLEKMVTGVSPYTHADNIPDQVRLVATTILAVTLNAKVLNDTKLISSIVEILLKSLKIDKLQIKLISIDGLQGLSHYGSSPGLESYFSLVVSSLVTSCLRVEHAYQLSLSSLYCISKMMENVSIDSLQGWVDIIPYMFKNISTLSHRQHRNIEPIVQDVSELVESVKTYLHDESEDHRAAALYLFSFLTSEIDSEVLITAVLLSSSEHDKTREASHQLLTNLAEIKNSIKLLNFLKSDQEPEMLLIIENILEDQVLFKGDYEGVLRQALEFSSKGSKKTRENSVILMTKILESFSNEVDETVSMNILERLVELLDDGEAEVKRTCANSIGIVMLAIGH